MKKYSTCILSLIGSAAGFAVVHAWTYSEALHDKARHHTAYEALWQAVFYDFMIGIPVAALCGWAVASLIRVRREAKEERVGSRG